MCVYIYFLSCMKAYVNELISLEDLSSSMKE